MDGVVVHSLTLFYLFYSPAPGTSAGSMMALYIASKGSATLDTVQEWLPQDPWAQQPLHEGSVAVGWRLIRAKAPHIFTPPWKQWLRYNSNNIVIVTILYAVRHMMYPPMLSLQTNDCSVLFTCLLFCVHTCQCVPKATGLPTSLSCIFPNMALLKYTCSPELILNQSVHCLPACRFWSTDWYRALLPFASGVFWAKYSAAGEDFCHTG